MKRIYEVGSQFNVAQYIAGATVLTIAFLGALAGNGVI